MEEKDEDIHEYALGILNKLDFEGMSLQQKVDLLARELKKPVVTETFIQEAIDYIAEYPSYKRLEKKLIEAGVSVA